MVSPYLNRSGLIEACRIRFMLRSPTNVPRFIWLASIKWTNGSSAGTPLHFAREFRRESPVDKPVWVTEGALKAQTVQNLRQDVQVFANSGVSCSHPEIIASARFEPLYIGFDGDGRTNLHVSRATANFVCLRFVEAEAFGFPVQVFILSWSPKFNGLDEALISDSEVSAITVSEWYASLSNGCKLDVLELIERCGIDFLRYKSTEA